MGIELSIGPLDRYKLCMLLDCRYAPTRFYAIWLIDPEDRRRQDGEKMTNQESRDLEDEIDAEWSKMVVG